MNDGMTIVGLIGAIIGAVIVIVYNILHNKIINARTHSDDLSKIREITIDNRNQLNNIKKRYMTKELCIAKEELTDTKFENIMNILADIKKKVDEMHTNGKGGK